jgi:dihydrofolate reductase
MRKMIVFIMVSLDGFFEGQNQELDWHNVDEEFQNFAIEQINAVDLLLFGRVTYELMSGFWPTPEAIKADPLTAEKMNAMPKIVFSTTLRKANWNNTRLVNNNIKEEIVKLKQEPGKDLIIFGSSDLTVSLTKLGLIDEYRFMINPVVIGNGKSLLKGIQKTLKLKLLKTKVFRSGNVLLYYQPNRKEVNTL